MHIRRWIIGFFVGVVVLAGAAIVTLTVLIDPNQFRDEIEQLVQNATGRPFEIRGNLEISWFPWLAVRMGPARLGNPPGVEGPHLAQWRSARMGARLVPLIKGQLIIDRIRFDGLQLRLHRSADGRANWEDLLASRPMPANRPGRPAPQIAGLEMRDSALELRDEQLGIQMNMLDWRLDIGEWHSGAPFPVRTEFMLTRSLEDEQPVGAEMRLTTEVQLGAKAQRLELRDIELESHLRGGTFTGEGIPVDLKMPELVASFSPLTFSVPKLSARVANAQVNGSLTVEQTESGLRARGPAEIEIASVRKLLTDLGVDAPLPRDKEALRTLTMKTDWSFSEGAVTLKPLGMQVDATKFTGEVARSGGEQPVWAFNLRGDRIDLGRYLLTEDKDDEPFELPVEALRALRVQGSLLFDHARFAETRMRNVRLRLIMEDGKLRSAARQP